MHGKVESIIRELAAEYLARESNRQSLLTVTRAQLSQTGKVATVFITVLPEDKEDAALAFVSRKSNDFWRYMKENSRLKVLPTIRFEIDKGEKNREKLDRLTG